MAVEKVLQLDSLPCNASTSLAAKQFYAVSVDSSGTLIAATAGNACHGILQDKPATGEAGVVGMYGISKVAISASQALTAFTTLLEVDTGGTLKAHASGVVVGRCRSTLASVANVTVVDADIFHVNSAF